MADLAYASLALRTPLAAHSPTATLAPPRLPSAPRPPAAAPGGPAGVPATVPSTRARPSGREWVRFLRRLLRCTDSLLVIVSVMAGLLVPFEGGQPSAGTFADLNGAFIAAVLGVMWIAALSLYRTRDPQILGAGSNEYKRVAAASGAVFGLLAVLLVAFRIQPASAFYLVSLPLGLILLPGSRWIARRWYNARQAQGQFLVKAIVIGQAEDVRYVLKRIARNSGEIGRAHV